jgi:hypothetical protein
MNSFQIPQKRVEGHMMPKTTFSTIAELLFNQYAAELGARAGRAMDKALNMDNRLSAKTRQKIYENFIAEVKKDDPILKAVS